LHENLIGFKSGCSNTSKTVSEKLWLDVVVGRWRRPNLWLHRCQS